MTNLFTPVIVDKFNRLLDLVDEDMKPKDRFVFKEAVYHKGHVIVRADSKLFGVMFNALTDTGEFPKGMSTCWRSWHHIKQDFNL